MTAQEVIAAFRRMSAAAIPKNKRTQGGTMITPPPKPPVQHSVMKSGNRWAAIADGQVRAMRATKREAWAYIDWLKDGERYIEVDGDLVRAAEEGWPRP